MHVFSTVFSLGRRRRRTLLSEGPLPFLHLPPRALTIRYSAPPEARVPNVQGGGTMVCTFRRKGGALRRRTPAGGRFALGFCAPFCESAISGRGPPVSRDGAKCQCHGAGRKTKVSSSYLKRAQRRRQPRPGWGAQAAGVTGGGRECVLYDGCYTAKLYSVSIIRHSGTCAVYNFERSHHRNRPGFSISLRPPRVKKIYSVDADLENSAYGGVLPPPNRALLAAPGEGDSDALPVMARSPTGTPGPMRRHGPRVPDGPGNSKRWLRSPPPRPRRRPHSCRRWMRATPRS